VEGLFGLYCIDRQAVWKGRKKERKHQKVCKKVQQSTVSSLVSGTAVGVGDGVNDSDAKAIIPKCVDMKDMDGVISLVLKLFPDIPK
jgi:hypothetical protein